jgi:5-methyltetrahydropteroyltriglutamate--homocysteine methyltransferase
LLTSVVGYPRIGANRELKFLTERYFNGQVTQDELLDGARELRAIHWRAQREAGIDLIPTGDFSFYDGLLDTAVWLGAVPGRYRRLGLSPLDTYFAMARGYQGEQGDAKALSMRKWFNTNYHYLVPELDDAVRLGLSSDAPFAQFSEATALGIAAKPVLIGPFTFLKLARPTGQKDLRDWAEDLVRVYGEALARFAALGAEWVQLDEPSLVTDLTAEDIALFQAIYHPLLDGAGRAGQARPGGPPARPGVKVLLQTYFGDIRDCYDEVLALDFDGVGLDFVESDRTIELVRARGFSPDTVLFAGVVNGKNVWRNDYDQTLALVAQLRQAAPRLALSTSCSLLHVPYTVAVESALADDQRAALAFAQEKLVELDDLRRLATEAAPGAAEDDPAAEAAPGTAADAAGEREASERHRATEADAAPGTAADAAGERQASGRHRATGAEGGPGAADLLKANREARARHRAGLDQGVRARAAALTDADYERRPARAERAVEQRAGLGLPALPTTTIGSFPQTGEVKANRARYRKGEIDRAAYEARLRELTAQCVALQQEIGLDVLVHGEFERGDMVEYFGENLDGFLFTKLAWVQSYGTRCVKPPIIWGDVKRRQPITVEVIRFAQSLTDRPVKAMLTGPVTILNWSFPREDVAPAESVIQIALAIRDEVLDLEAAGVRIIQIDEAALREKLPLRRADWRRGYLDWAIPAFRLVHSAVAPSTQIHTHMCYSEFEDIVQDIDAMDADVISFEAARSGHSIVGALKEAGFATAVGPGVYDIHSPRVPPAAEIESGLRSILAALPAESVWVNPDCGLKTRAPAETEASLRNLVAAARTVRAGLG